jgi:putative hydrolase of the HAD superfamily
VDLYLFDFDRTLYAYDFRLRLPTLALLTGASQYHLAKTWWAGGYERRAEAGEWPTSAEYLAEFGRVTGTSLSLEQWREARALASTRIPGSVDAAAHAVTLGRVGLFSNNPAPFGESLDLLAPDVSGIVGSNVVVSYQIGLRKPDPAAFRLALERLGARADETFFADDSRANVEGAASIGITAHLFDYVDGVPQTAALDAAIDRFAARGAANR